jgi:hypothetical protein
MKPSHVYRKFDEGKGTTADLDLSQTRKLLQERRQVNLESR